MAQRKAIVGIDLEPAETITIMDHFTGQAMEYPNTIAAYVCHKCSLTHFQISIGSRAGHLLMTLNLRLTPEEAEELARRLINPLPLNPDAIEIV